MAVVHQQVVPGIRKAAIVMLLLGEELSSEVFKHLSEEEIEELSKEMAALGPVPSHLGEKILDEFHQTTIAAEFVTRGDIEYARRVLLRTVGPDVAKRIMDRVLRSFQSTAGFTSLE
jgi:flagellar motor switch protein FliG